ncbi:hypothetical protein ACLQ29_17260 [Micromonospora sp. DT228]|uniref:hypothetical protein n=1 Tax=Micromonospora sp. DT228 TaxID=3393443 RepID=UPI003CF8ED22
MSPALVIGSVALLLFTPALAHWSPMAGLSVVAGVLTLVALLDMLRGRGAPLEPPAPPIGREATDVREPEA